MQANFTEHYLIATQEIKVAKLCSWPTKLKRCIANTKLVAKLEFLTNKNLIVDVRYLESARLQILCG